MAMTADLLHVQPVIMAGGSGTRLWPLSRAGYPKQFLVLDGNASLLQQAAQRLAALREVAPTAAAGGGTVGDGSVRGGHDVDVRLEVAAPIVVGNEEHRFLVLDQLREARCEPSSLILEPLARNTAPALTLAALQAVQAAKGDIDPVLVVTPADHSVTDPSAFTAALARAVVAAAQGAIVTLGITPDRPDTGFGYIQAGAAGDDGVHEVQRFVEKPDLATATAYLAEGGYYWNGGIFVLRASTWLQALERFRPDIARQTQLAFDARSTDAAFVRPAREAFARVPSDSVDYAVMERCPGSGIGIAMVPLQAGWNDLGAWDAVWQVAPKDAHGNAAAGDVLFHDSRDTLVHATSRLVGVIGLQDVVVVETADAVLVSDRARSQQVKVLVSALERQRRVEHTVHRKVHRPWGWYDSIDAGDRFQVKRIMVKPGASLSLQMHHHRAEHWIVVRGTAEVTCGERRILLTENQSTYIPLGETHRLANPGKVPLEIIEVQSGSYLGEDDIVRFEDSYGRG
jgi:mannose-1-phosphate guanylyltransferase/mannose-6-phosphate isomerase